MRLKALEMQGFKSFPDKTVFNFNHGMTAVVGPNGSGKSNIADAVRWVLGEQSTKNLRGSKMEDVIFGGTKIRKPLGFAEVTLRLDNTDRTLDSDRDEVSVTRRYFRSGESEYMLNGQVVRLRDVHEIFMDTGLGRDGYSLVSQGRIADLISSKSGQRRDMLEEAAGISHYRYRRNDANRKLDQAEENLVRLRDILSELESRVGPLKTQSEKAQKFLVLAKEKKELEIGLWLHTIDTTRVKLRDQEDKLSIAQGQYDSVEAALTQIETDSEEIIAKSQDITVRIDNIRNNSTSYEEKAVQLEGQISVEKNTILHNEQTIERIRRDMSDASNSENTLKKEVEDAQAEIAELLNEIEAKRKELDSAALNIADAKNETGEFADRIAEISQKITALTEKVSEKRIEETTANSSIEEISGRVSNIEGVLSTRNGYITELEDKRNACQSQLDKLNDTATEIMNAVSGYSLRVNNRQEKADKLKSAIDARGLDILQKKDKIRMLDEMEKNMDGYSGAVKAVVREAKGGALRGIHGPLSQLISVEDRYAIAVETALGSAIQNIVTDSENDAKRAINFLKENKSGRATFLPLTSVKSKPFTEKGLDDCYGFVDMADRLLDYDKKYDEIIRSLLGRTAVAEDLDSAIVIAKKFSYRFKIVTLDGQVVNAGGSMTGGSRGHNSGILSRTNEKEKLNEQLKKLAAEQEKDNEEYKRLNIELSSAKAELDASEADLKRTQEDIIRKESELALIDGKLDTANAALEELRREKKNASIRITDLEALKSAAQTEIDRLNKEMGSLQADLDVVTHGREKLEEKKEELAQIEAKINLDILALEKDIEAKKEAVDLLNRRMASHEGRLDDLNDEIAIIEKANSDIELKIQELTKQAQEFHELGASAKSDIEALINERTQCDAKSAQLRSEERAKSAEREKISGELARLEERKAQMEKQLDDAVNKLFDEYQLTKSDAEALNIVIEDYQQAHRSLQELKGKIRALGNVNVGAIEEYKEVSERYEFMKAQLDDIEKSRDELNRLITELTSKMAEQFKAQFVRINSYFGETFVELFGGGKAELILENPNDVLECNIEIKVQPPGKNVQNIDLLSGGEKGLSAIALLFAILKVAPSPFCIFDEVEAALDDVNVARYARYVRRMTANTQFILITHRRGTMEEADVLYGITMQEEGVSKLLELQTAEMAKKLGIS
ncbi:MAG: chromosome segregation protein SMC [Clostridiaceae bacterium]|nr:chromosome segregation protein SMC [Clostridiaceae bacterium]MDY5888839.1 chromosome segregation protein SMC [Oscillospiraceae bacterium]